MIPFIQSFICALIKHAQKIKWLKDTKHNPSCSEKTTHETKFKAKKSTSRVTVNFSCDQSKSVGDKSVNKKPLPRNFSELIESDYKV